MVLNVHSNLKAYQGRGGGGREYRGKREIIYLYRYTVNTRMIPALGWAAMKAILGAHVCVRACVCACVSASFTVYFVEIL